MWDFNSANWTCIFRSSIGWDRDTDDYLFALDGIEKQMITFLHCVQSVLECLASGKNKIWTNMYIGLIIKASILELDLRNFITMYRKLNSWIHMTQLHFIYIYLDTNVYYQPAGTMKNSNNVKKINIEISKPPLMMIHFLWKLLCSKN